MGQGPASAPVAATTSGPTATVPGAPTITAVAQDPATYGLVLDIKKPSSTGGSSACKGLRFLPPGAASSSAAPATMPAGQGLGGVPSTLGCACPVLRCRHHWIPRGWCARQRRRQPHGHRDGGETRGLKGRPPFAAELHQCAGADTQFASASWPHLLPGRPSGLAAAALHLGRVAVPARHAVPLLCLCVQRPRAQRTQRAPLLQDAGGARGACPGVGCA